MRVSEAILWVDAILLSGAIGWALVVAYIPSPNYVLLRRLFWVIAIGIGIFVFVWDVTATQSAWVRVPFVALASAAIGVFVVEGARWSFREATFHQSSVQATASPHPEKEAATTNNNTVLQIATSQIGVPNCKGRALFYSDPEKDAPVLLLEEVYIKNTSLTQTLTMTIQLHAEDGRSNYFNLFATGHNAFGNRPWRERLWNVNPKKDSRRSPAKQALYSFPHHLKSHKKQSVGRYHLCFGNLIKNSWKQ